MTDARHRTERVYDEEMAPLVAQLIEISKREQIPLFVVAGMLDEKEEPISCHTAMVFGKNRPERCLLGLENRIGLCLGIIRGHSGFDRASGLMISRFHPPDEPDCSNSPAAGESEPPSTPTPDDTGGLVGSGASVVGLEASPELSTGRPPQSVNISAHPPRPPSSGADERGSGKPSPQEEELGPPIPDGGHEMPGHPSCRCRGRALGYHADDLSTLCAACDAADEEA